MDQFVSGQSGAVPVQAVGGYLTVFDGVQFRNLADPAAAVPHTHHVNDDIDSLDNKIHVRKEAMKVRIRKLYVKRQRLLGALNGIVNEKVTNYKTVTAYNQQESVVADCPSAT